MNVPITRSLLVGTVAVVCATFGASATYALTRPRTERRPVVVEEGRPIGKSGPLTHVELAPKTEAVAASDSDFKPVSFATLGSYLYELPSAADLSKQDRIPQPIKALNGTRVAIQGFMLPLDLKNGKSGAFLLLKDQGLCCRGATPRMNEWISVKMICSRTARVVPDQPVTVFGILEVGEIIDKGEVLSVYRLNAFDVAGPLDL